MDENTLVLVEKQRLELEENINKFRQSLRYWQTTELDYEGLKQELFALPDDSTVEECMKAARESQPELVKVEEIHKLISELKSNHKRPLQLFDLLSKRQDYVSRNVSTIRRQLSDAERKRNSLLLARNPDYKDDAALPLAEITEELDDVGNVLSSKVQDPAKTAPELVDVLEKAGVRSVVERGGTDEVEDENAIHERSIGTQSDTPEPRPKDVSAKSEEEKTDDHSDNQGSDVNKEIQVEPGKQSQTSSPKPLQPTNLQDTEEDAKLRQEMLQYGLDEVGAIVAELDLVEDATDASYDEDDEDDMDYDSEDDNDENEEEPFSDESEDEHGRTKRPVISEKYKRKMEELEKSLGLKDMQNLGPTPELPGDIKQQLSRPPAAKAAAEAAIARQKAAKGVLKTEDTEDTGSKSSTEPKAKKAKKRVAFAPALDVAQETPATTYGSHHTSNTEDIHDRKSEPLIKAVEERILERSSTSTSAPPPREPTSTSNPVSRFKSVRSGTLPTPMSPPPMMDLPHSSKKVKDTPQGPPGRTVADSLVERTGSKSVSDVPAPNPDTDDFDEGLQRRQIALEYQRLRNKKIHEQGGYVEGGEEDNYGDETATSIVEDDGTGRRQKVSRFKAARMKF